LIISHKYLQTVAYRLSFVPFIIQMIICAFILQIKLIRLPAKSKEKEVKR